MKITQELIKKLFDYRNDGSLVWKENVGSVHADSLAGSINNKGYRQIKIGGKKYEAHRLVWLWHYGYSPEKYVDHINRDSTDNRIENLREASNQCNQRNSKRRHDNKSGVKGVGLVKDIQKWRAQIKVNGKDIHLGSHSCLVEAACHRLAAEQCLDWCRCDSLSPAHKYVISTLC